MKAFLPNDQSGATDDFALVRKRMRDRLNTRHHGRIWLACSGGLDSMVLMHTLHDVCKESQTWELGVFHVNFGLRAAEADADAAFVQAEASRLSLPCRVRDVLPSEQPSGGIQEWARDLRYQWFASQMGEGDWLALGHHGDDLAETVLMRIARGAHLGQLLGMEEWKDRIWRPFLGLTREALEHEAERQKIPHREDSSNAKLVYSRNRVRHLILPELEAMYPGVRKSLLQLASEARDFVRHSEKALQAGESLGADDLEGLEPAVARQRISAFVAFKCSELRLSRRILVILHGSLISGERICLNLDSRHQAVAACGRLRVESRVRRSSARWNQYRKRLTDERPRMWLANNVRYEQLT